MSPGAVLPRPDRRADETTSTDPTAAAEALSLHDGWVKATEDDEDMTAVFGTPPTIPMRTSSWRA